MCVTISITKIVPVKKKKKHQNVKKIKIIPVKRNILPMKKYKTSAREKEKWEWKKLKKVYEKNTLHPWKIRKNI